MTTQTVSTGITRFEIDSRKGYMVRISRKGKRYNQYFSDAKYGGKRKALAAAKAAYEAMLAKHGPAQTSTKNKLTERNSTGVVGVHIAHSRDNRYEHCEYDAYCASWVTEKGKRKKISFSWNRYGKEQAWELAVLARKLENNNRDQVVAKHARRRSKQESSSLGPSKRRVGSSKKKASKKPSTRKQAKQKLPKKKAVKKKTAKQSVKKTVKRKTKQVSKQSRKRQAGRRR